jgi:hypothetical protein
MAFTLKRDSWKRSRPDNLSNQAVLEGRRGPDYDKFWAAKDLWDSLGDVSLRVFFTAATNLQAAFDKFIKSRSQRAR